MFSKDYFSEDEFKKCIPSCLKSDMNIDFLNRLNKARKIANIPFILNCAFRSVAWDLSKGRTGTSYHCKGRAVDIRCKDSYSRAIIVKALFDAGFTGIGIADTFIHCDDRKLKQIWLYE